MRPLLRASASVELAERNASTRRERISVSTIVVPCFPQPAYPRAGELAQLRLHVQILRERTVHKANALCVGACEQQNTVADHPVAQQDGRVIEEHEVDEVAPDGTGRSANHAEEQTLPAAGRIPARRAWRTGLPWSTIVSQP